MTFCSGRLELKDKPLSKSYTAGFEIRHESIVSVGGDSMMYLEVMCIKCQNRLRCETVVHPTTHYWV